MSVIKNAKRGTRVLVEVVSGLNITGNIEPHTVMGFSMGDGPVYKDWASFGEAYGFKSFTDADRFEAEHNRGENYGKNQVNFWMTRTNEEGPDFEYAAYRFEGNWCISSGADRIKVELDLDNPNPYVR